jgi:hypothetical protein
MSAVVVGAVAQGGARSTPNVLSKDRFVGRPRWRPPTYFHGHALPANSRIRLIAPAIS